MHARVGSLVEDYNQVREALARTRVERLRRQIEARLAASRRYHQRLTRQVRRAVAEERRQEALRRRALCRGVAAPGQPGAVERRPHVGLGNLAPGDLVFFAYNVGNPSTIRHVGIYVGGGARVEGPYSGARVRLASIGRRDYIGAVRPTG